ncbi:hypothetical protein [Ascidiimonas aurantiaca]|uniref:hypothetical protein n=1 Tax=Ascidiimonas aurantiaca TaxID=1685432 RepID=UPI0030EEB3B1
MLLKKDLLHAGLLIVCVLLTSFLGYTQSDTRDWQVLNEIQQVASTEVTGIIQNSAIAQMSDVYIYQSGEFNTAHVYTRGNGSSVSVNQLGLNNNTELFSEYTVLESHILQQGSNNRITAHYFGNEGAVFNEFVQNGSNLTLEKYGANSISQGIRVTMQGQSRSIIIRSY